VDASFFKLPEIQSFIKIKSFKFRLPDHYY